MIEEIKLLPEAANLETLVIVYAMKGRAPLEEIYEHLKRPEFFFSEQCRVMYDGLLNLRAKDLPVDENLLISELKAQGRLQMAGGDIYIKKLSREFLSYEKAVEYSKKIAVAFIQREVIRICTEGKEWIHEEQDVFSCISRIEKELQAVSENISNDSVVLLGDVATKSITKIHERRQQTITSTGVPTGWPKLDRLTGGWQPTDLALLAARPSVGKTALLLNLLVNAATNATKPYSSLVFSLEMSDMQLTNRVLSRLSGVAVSNIMRNVKALTEFDLQQLEIARERASKIKIHIDDKGASTIGHITAIARKKVKKEGVGLIAIDYVQLIRSTAKSNNRERELAQISSELKAMAKDLEVPVIALAQLTREADNVEPELKHLRESGALEQDADIVGLIHRPPKSERDKDAEKENLLILSIKKHRNGGLDDISLTFNRHTQEIIERAEPNPFASKGFIPMSEAEQKFKTEEDAPF